MKKRFALELLAIVLLTAIVALFEKVYFDGGCFVDDEMLMNPAFQHAALTITVPMDHVADSPQAGKDH